ncbi:uncharacterized protein LOC144534558 isoform X4 [Sander vitreus]
MHLGRSSWLWGTADKHLPTHMNREKMICSILLLISLTSCIYVHEGVEVPESQDEQFAGRVQWDKDVLRGGRLRLHVSRLRTEDSGRYVCQIITNYVATFFKCRLNVTAARDWPKPDLSPTANQLQPESWERINIWSGLILTAGLTSLLLAFYLLFLHSPLKKLISFIYSLPCKQESSPV